MRRRRLPRRRRTTAPAQNRSGLRKWLLTYAIRLLSTSRPSYELMNFVLAALGKDALHGLAEAIGRFEKKRGTGRDEGDWTRSADELQDHAVNLMMGPPRVSAKMQKAVLRVLRQELRSAQPVPPEIVKAFRDFGKKLDLPPAALAVLRFYFVRSSFDPLSSHLDSIPLGPDLFTLLAAATRVPVAEVRKAVQSGAPLMELEILSMRRSPPHSLELEDSFFLSLAAGSADSSNKYFSKSMGPVFALSSFPVQSRQIRILVDLLKASTPAQILLAGRQGTGKTELARSLCRAVRRPALFVALSPEGMEAQRKVALRVTVNQARASNAVVIVDEADDFLNVMQWSIFGPSKERQSKGALNDFMDHTPATIIWLTNRIDAIDRSTLRRFHYSLWFRAFNRTQRLHMWRTALKGHSLARYLPPDTVRVLAAKYKVDAAGISLALDRTASVLSQRKEKSAGEAVGVLSEFLSRHLHLISGSTASAAHQDGPAFDPALLNVVSGNLNTVIHRFDSHASAPAEQRRGLLMLFAGPPGTGKSALIQYLADRADLDTIHIRAIDLIRDREEGHVRYAFAEAEASGALLVVDDIEAAFPSAGDRNPALYQAARSEFAASLKHFRGVLCATSKAPELIDPVIASHFDLVASLGLPERIHLVGLSKHYLPTPATGPAPSSLAPDTVRSLTGLSHADFAMAHRRMKSGWAHGQDIEDLFQRSAIRPDIRKSVL